MTIYHIIAGVALLAAIILWAIYRYKVRYLVTKWCEDTADDVLAEVTIPVSVVVISQNAGADLERHVPRLMEQRGVTYEVVVVDAASTDTTVDALKRLKTNYPTLRQTYVPQSHANLDVWDFATVLGARAARHEWVLFVHAEFCPPSETWLQDLMQYVDESIHAFVDYGHVTRDFLDELSSFARRRECRKMARTALRGRAISAAGGSVLVKKDWYLDRANREERVECIYQYHLRPSKRVILRVRSRQGSDAFQW